MKPVYRFTIGSSIFVFGMAETLTRAELLEFLDQFGYIKLHDGSFVTTDRITDVRVYDVECPVYLIMNRNGQMVKAF